jgi:hypothetical protein
VREQLGKIIDEHVRRIFLEVVAAKSVGHAADPGPGIARCLYIDFRIADDHGLRGSGAEFAQDRINAHRVGLLALEAVAAIDKTKVIADAQLLDNVAADSHGLIRVDSHRHSLQRIERFAHAWIQNRVVEFVRGVILDEKFQANPAIFFGGVAAQRTGDQRWGALPHITENLLVRQRITP